MPRFPELDASLGETLDLPVPLPSGQVKEYKVPPVDAETWTWITKRFIASSDDEEVDDTSETTIYRRCLGDALYDQMVADKVYMDQIRRAGLTALAWHIHGDAHALRVWEGGLEVPKRSTSKTAETTGTPAEDPSTPTPDSESGITPTPPKTTRSRGRTSSTGGRSSKRTSTRSTASTSASPDS